VVFMLAAAGRPPAQLRQAPGQPVACPLKLLEAHQPGPAGRGRRLHGGDEREALRNDPRELGLELGDLRAQHGARGELGLGRRFRRRQARRAARGGEGPRRGRLTIDDRLLVLGQDPFSCGRLEGRSLPAAGEPGAPSAPAHRPCRALAALHRASSR